MGDPTETTKPAPELAKSKPKKKGGSYYAKLRREKKAKAKAKAKKRKVVKTAVRKINGDARTERLDMRLTKTQKAKIDAKAKKTRRTVTSLVIEAIEKIR
jgi:hypothetical protein